MDTDTCHTPVGLPSIAIPSRSRPPYRSNGRHTAQVGIAIFRSVTVENVGKAAEIKFVGLRRQKLKSVSRPRPTVNFLYLPTNG